jgi:malate dehydrogenase (oxaloacetate-decarboxylating)(NADP+)
MVQNKEALDYHSGDRHGKIEVIATKPCTTQRDLSLAYTPGVAVPCLEIEKNPEDAFKYTAKGNLVAVISNGTAVLGLGDIGPLGAKPVMEGKGVLFKRFADVDVFDIELDTKDPQEIIRTVKLLEPTFGGINLEDIKGPECFEIEETLKEQMNIPVFHDDQHGTAIISGAALLNALDLVDKKIEEIKVVYNGAGAAGIACADLFVELGVRVDNILMCDSKGVLYKGRTKGMNKYKERFARDTDCRTLDDAMRGADCFVGVSVKGAVTQEMVKSMARDPIILAMANPDPEITYPDAIAARDDVIMATGRSDYPNQVNNVLGFPFIFRGALDCRARAINQEMKVAAVKSLAALAREDVPDEVCHAYGVESIQFGREYIIPKPFDPRVLLWEAPAVAKAAMETGVARIEFDIEEYREKLESRLGRARQVMRGFINRARMNPKKIVFPEGNSKKILRACHTIIEEGIGTPVLIGNRDKILNRIRELHLTGMDDIEIHDVRDLPKLEEYAAELATLRARKGVTHREARELMKNRFYYAAMVVHMKDADCFVGGVTTYYKNAVTPVLDVIGPERPGRRVAGMYLLIWKHRLVVCADTTMNIDPDAETLCDIAILAAKKAKEFGLEPRVAMLSYSNFGSVSAPSSKKVARATQLVQEKCPDLIVDGEMQVTTALDGETLRDRYPFSKIQDPANVLVFPDLNSGNIAYKLLDKLGGASVIGPILIGIRDSAHVLQRRDDPGDIVKMAALAVVDAQEKEKKHAER